MLYYAKLNGQIKIQVHICGLVYAKTYSIFRKEKNWLQAKANLERNKEYVQKLEKNEALLELQNQTLLKEIKKHKQLYKCKCNSKNNE